VLAEDIGTLRLGLFEVADVPRVGAKVHLNICLTSDNIFFFRLKLGILKYSWEKLRKWLI
jgi:hypothetical protein